MRSAQAATARALAAMVPGDADWDATHHAYISAVMHEREALTAYFGASEEARKWVKVDGIETRVGS